jgi:hypothetical protein
MKIASISIGDYCEAVEGMPHDVERLYFRMILKMCSREAGLPDDDDENARMFGYRDVRTFKHLKSQLLRWPDTISVQGGEIVNKRVMADIAKVKVMKEQAAVNGRIGGISKKDRQEIGQGSVKDRTEIDATSGIDVESILYTTNNQINDLAKASPSPTPLREEKTPLTPHGEVVANAPTKARKAPGGISKAECIGAFIQFSELAQRIGLPIPATMTPGREKSIRSRLRDHGAASWSTALAAIEASVFLRGRSEKADFKISLDWLISPKNFPKVIEGNYGPKIAASTSETHWTQDPAKVAAVTPDQWRGSIAKYANGTWPVDKLGYWPGHRNCIVPPQIVRELKLLDKYDEVCGIAKGEWKREQDRAHA